ncbi:hypothetical protein GUJ93_ZPchr0003g18427 [Zizania palustris]|uniref:Uncharacterized protein n=1 Tax=Zizania palustris TaxID=103762 RepID=A0A8J5VL83_ZIZPA|nr:hypothetical protein GUJ93_ZPchr0003g18427 [Zizania palustris]
MAWSQQHAAHGYSYFAFQTHLMRNQDAAQKDLRKRGVVLAAKKSLRTVAEGLLAFAQYEKRVVVVELNRETDFVARNDVFQYLQLDHNSDSVSEEDMVDGLLIISDTKECYKIPSQANLIQHENVKRKRKEALKRRKDVKLKHVIISEHVDKKAEMLLSSNLPFLYTSKDVYEQSIRMPIGPDFNSATSVSALNRPVLSEPAGLIDVGDVPEALMVTIEIKPELQAYALLRFKRTSPSSSTGRINCKPAWLHAYWQKPKNQICSPNTDIQCIQSSQELEGMISH